MPFEVNTQKVKHGPKGVDIIYETDGCLTSLPQSIGVICTFKLASIEIHVPCHKYESALH